MFAYSHQTFCDSNGFVLTTVTVPGNIHDSVSFFEAYNVLSKKYKDQIKNICLDAGYNNSAICKTITENSQKIIVPYHRPMTKKDTSGNTNLSMMNRKTSISARWDVY